jgi:5-methylcytosine-specific restriction enzyme A
MPSAPPRPCAEPGCPQLVAFGRCPRHRRESKPSAAARGYGWRWWERRARVLREEPYCGRCRDEGRVRFSAEVDHIIPKSRGGSDARENLQGICAEHHAAKSRTEQPRRGQGGALALAALLLLPLGACERGRVIVLEQTQTTRIILDGRSSSERVRDESDRRQGVASEAQDLSRHRTESP